jgi:hypothetical protein
LLEKANVSIDTSMCVEENVDDKALMDTILKEVQKTKLQVHNIHVNGGDMNMQTTISLCHLRDDPPRT